MEEVEFNDGCSQMHIRQKTVYENKPVEWKLCYRAGKETVEAARAVASQWLGGLKRSK
jgi:hypothetical protein